MDIKDLDVEYYKTVWETQNDPEILKSELKDLINDCLRIKTDGGAEVPCNVGLDTLFFMEKRLPHLLNIAEELLTWCIEEDKKGICKDLLKKYRKEHEAIIGKGV